VKDDPDKLSLDDQRYLATREQVLTDIGDEPKLFRDLTRAELATLDRYYIIEGNPGWDAEALETIVAHQRRIWNDEPMLVLQALRVLEKVYGKDLKGLISKLDRAA
jgi:hypothetical protein